MCVCVYNDTCARFVSHSEAIFERPPQAALAYGKAGVQQWLLGDTPPAAPPVNGPQPHAHPPLLGAMLFTGDARCTVREAGNGLQQGKRTPS